jgi:tetratricopeptide (TPR) repeat protein
MARTGRNDPCPCGSGKKYKRCCLEKDEATAAAAGVEQDQSLEHPHEQGEVCPSCGASTFAAGYLPDEDALELELLSNKVVDLVHAGRLDEAEYAAHRLLDAFPEVHDGYDRLGMVAEARGDLKKAAEYYRKVLEVIDQHQDDYDPAFAAQFHRLIARLDPPFSPSPSP